MDNKDIDFRYKYFTFPLKFLHVPPAGYKIRFDLILRWSIYEFLRRTKFLDPETPVTEKERWIRRALNFSGGNIASWKAGWDTLQELVTGGEVYTSIFADYLFEARDGGLDPNLLLLTAAIRSVIGPKRRFAKTNRQVIVERMFGSPYRLTRYSFDKLCLAASNRGMMTRIPAGRGFYVSICLKTDQLKQAVMDRVKNYEAKKLEQIEAGRQVANLKRTYRTYRKIPQLIYN